MANPNGPAHEEKTQLRSLRARKAGLRLGWLLTLQPGELRALKERETLRLRTLEHEIRKATEHLGDHDPEVVRKAREELQRLHTRLFSPVTAGIHFHDDSSGSRQWNRGFQEPFVSALVVSDVNARDLRQEFGVIVRCQTGDTSTVLVPLARLAALADSTAVRKIELARATFPQLDYAIPFAQIDKLHGAGHEGTDTLVGIIDDGLDLKHPDFLQTDATGKEVTRVLYYWDQSIPSGAAGTEEAAPPTDPELPGFQPEDGASYGVELDSETIDGWRDGTVVLSEPPEPGEHGTIVTGCAVGNARAYEKFAATNPDDPILKSPSSPAAPPKGAAPKAGILFVKRATVEGSEILGDSTAVLDAFHYLFARAEKIGAACVVNLSDSDDQGGHDGRALGEKTLDKLLDAPGRAITLSAGNSSATSTHATTALEPGETKTLELAYFDNFGLPTNSDAIEIWYSGSDGLAVTLTVPGKDGDGVTPAAAATTLLTVKPGEWAEHTVGELHVEILSEVPVPENGDNRIQILITPELSGGAVPAGWSIPVNSPFEIALGLPSTAAGAVKVHAWVDRNNRGRVKWAEEFRAELECTVSVPGTAAGPITVAAHQKKDPPTVPTWFESSGRGPTRPTEPEGPEKPDLATVGYSTFTPYRQDHPFITAGFPYGTASGTSVSAPIVAGTCALVFECLGKELFCADVKSKLLAAAAPQEPENDFGAGYLQASTVCDLESITPVILLPGEGEEVEPSDESRLPFWQLLRALEVTAVVPPDGPGPPTIRTFDITVRNESKRDIEDAAIELAWTAPTTSLESERIWSASRFSVAPSSSGGPASPSGNRFRLSKLGPGKAATVRFHWDGKDAEWPGKEPGDMPSFRARVVGKKPVRRRTRTVAIDRSVALSSVITRKIRPRKPVEARFDVRPVGGGGLRVIPKLEKGEVVLQIPVRALPWRDLRWLKKNGAPLAPWDGNDTGEVPKAPRSFSSKDIHLVTGIRGASELTIRDRWASIHLAAEGRRPELIVPELRVAPGTDAVPVRLRVEKARGSDRRQAVHVLQTAGGRRIGGLSLELLPAGSGGSPA